MFLFKVDEVDNKRTEERCVSPFEASFRAGLSQVL